MKDFESKMAELESINDELSTGQLKLADALEKYRRGVQLSQELDQLLSQAESEIVILTNQADSLQEKPILTSYENED